MKKKIFTRTALFFTIVILTLSFLGSSFIFANETFPNKSTYDFTKLSINNYGCQSTSQYPNGSGSILAGKEVAVFPSTTKYANTVNSRVVTYNHNYISSQYSYEGVSLFDQQQAMSLLDTAPSFLTSFRHSVYLGNTLYCKSLELELQYIYIDPADKNGLVRNVDYTQIEGLFVPAFYFSFQDVYAVVNYSRRTGSSGDDSHSFDQYTVKVPLKVDPTGACSFYIDFGGASCYINMITIYSFVNLDVSNQYQFAPHLIDNPNLYPEKPDDVIDLSNSGREFGFGIFWKSKGFNFTQGNLEEDLAMQELEGVQPTINAKAIYDYLNSVGDLRPPNDFNQLINQNYNTLGFVGYLVSKISSFPYISSLIVILSTVLIVSAITGVVVVLVKKRRSDE